jgi:hypothetical protein
VEALQDLFDSGHKLKGRGLARTPTTGDSVMQQLTRECDFVLGEEEDPMPFCDLKAFAHVCGDQSAGSALMIDTYHKSTHLHLKPGCTHTCPRRQTEDRGPEARPHRDHGRPPRAPARSGQRYYESNHHGRTSSSHSRHVVKKLPHTRKRSRSKSPRGTAQAEHVPSTPSIETHSPKHEATEDLAITAPAPSGHSRQVVRPRDRGTPYRKHTDKRASRERESKHRTSTRASREKDADRPAATEEEEERFMKRFAKLVPLLVREILQTSQPTTPEDTAATRQPRQVIKMRKSSH